MHNPESEGYACGPTLGRSSHPVHQFAAIGCLDDAGHAALEHHLDIALRRQPVAVHLHT